MIKYLIFLLSITTSFAQLHVSTFGVKGDGVTDDAPALNRAIAAAILNHDKLIIPAPANFYNIKSTLNIVPAPGQTQAWVKIEAWGHRNNFIVYTGPSNQPAVKIIGVKGGAIDGLMVRVANGISGITVYEIGTEGASNSTGGFVMDNCDASLGDKANIGWRFGFIEGGNADISQILLSECAVWGSGVEGQIGFQNVGRNTLQLTWVGGAATKVDKAIMTTAGGSQYFFGFGGAYNNTDFHIASSNNFAVYGGRFEHGKTFLFTSNASSHPTIAFYGTMLGKYEQPSGYFIDMQRPGTLRLEGLKVENPNKTNRIRLGGNTGAGIGNLTVTGGAWHSSEPIYQIDKPGTWKVTIDNVGKLDANYASSSYFTNTTTPVITPPIDPPVEPPLATNKFVGTYFDNVNFTGTSFTREDAKIDFNWGNGSPDPRIAADTYSARWEGTFDFAAGTYTFTAKVDDGVRIFVDDEKILESWKDQAVATYTATKTMTAGIHKVRVEYYENGGSAELTVDWKAGTPPVVVVPPDPTGPPAGAVIVQPGQSIKAAVERPLAAGVTVYVNNGTYNEQDIKVPPLINVKGQSKAGVIVNGLTMKSYTSGVTGQESGVFLLVSTGKTNGNQTIANMTINCAGKSLGGVNVYNRDNVTVEDLDVSNGNFYGVWVMYSKGSTFRRLNLTNNSWASASWASGEFCYVEIDNFLIEDVMVSSTVPTRGYGFKAIWGEVRAGIEYRNMYNGRFNRIKTAMHQQSLWANGASHNIGFEMHGVNLMGNILIENAIFGNQVSLHTWKCNPGSMRITGSQWSTANDRYSIEGIICNLEVDQSKFVNTSQWFFNGKKNFKVNNWNIHDNEYDQGSAPNTGWGAVFLFGGEGASNIVVRNNNIKKRSGNDLTKFQGISGGLNTDILTANTITNF